MYILLHSVFWIPSKTSTKNVTKCTFSSVLSQVVRLFIYLVFVVFLIAFYNLWFKGNLVLDF